MDHTEDAVDIQMTDDLTDDDEDRDDYDCKNDTVHAYSQFRPLVVLLRPSRAIERSSISPYVQKSAAGACCESSHAPVLCQLQPLFGGRVEFHKLEQKKKKKLVVVSCLPRCL